jgi:hypothetical protein
MPSSCETSIDELSPGLNISIRRLAVPFTVYIDQSHQLASAFFMDFNIQMAKKELVTCYRGVDSGRE